VGALGRALEADVACSNPHLPVFVAQVVERYAVLFQRR